MTTTSAITSSKPTNPIELPIGNRTKDKREFTPHSFSIFVTKTGK